MVPEFLWELVASYLSKWVLGDENSEKVAVEISCTTGSSRTFAAHSSARVLWKTLSH